MKIVEEYEHFIEGARLDWLHPSHGRWPDLVAAVVDHYKGSYLVAVWQDGEDYAAMVEGPEQLHTIIQSYRWNRSGKVWWCRVDDLRMEEVWAVGNNTARIRQLACASCHLFNGPS